MTLILQTFPMPPGPQADLERDYEVRQAPFPDGDELRAAAVGSVGVIAGTEPWSRELLEANAGTLRCISRVGTGVDSIDLDAATDAGVAVLNGPGEMSQTVAEYAVGMMWTLAGPSGRLTRRSTTACQASDAATQAASLKGHIEAGPHRSMRARSATRVRCRARSSGGPGLLHRT